MTSATGYIEDKIRREMPPGGPKPLPTIIRGVGPFRTRIWCQSFAEEFEPREGWMTEVEVVITRPWWRARFDVSVSAPAQDGYTEYRQEELARQAVAWITS